MRGKRVNGGADAPLPLCRGRRLPRPSHGSACGLERARWPPRAAWLQTTPRHRAGAGARDRLTVRVRTGSGRSTPAQGDLAED